MSNLEMTIKSVMGLDNYITTIAVQHNPKGRDKEFFADSHEYMLLSAKNKSTAQTNRLSLSQSELTKKYKKQEGDNQYRELPLRRSGSEAQREDRPYMYFPFLCSKNDLKLSLLPENEYSEIYKNNLFHDDFVNRLKEKYERNGYFFVLPIRKDGSQGRWGWGFKSCKAGINDGVLFAKRDNDKITIYQLDEADDTFLPKTFWYGEQYDASSKGTNILKNIVPNNIFDYPKSVYLVQDILTIGANSDDLILDYFAGSGTTAHAVINLNREDGGRRKYILVEQGEYFDTMLKPRVQKVVYAENWKDGKPEADKVSGSLHGVPQIVKALKLESYEDTLNNLVLKDNGDLFNQLNDGAKEDYLLRYMLADQSRDSLLNTEVFRRPFNYQMDIATNSAGATERMDIDLVETFNYLLGLRVHAVKDRIEKDGYLTVEGTLPDGETALVLWRDCEKVGYEGLDTLLGRLKINPQDSEYGTVYINGDHNIATVWENENGVSGSLKVRQIESEFMALMFGEAQ